MMIVKGVNVYPRQIEATLLRQPGFGHEYRIVLEADAGGERMTVDVEVEPGHDPGAIPRVRRELQDLLGVSAEIRTCAPGVLERSPGKAVRVVDRRGVAR
jgi:phenylacetate-CoA ligase